MSSFEGMWKFQSGSADAPERLLWGGIIVLESGRVFGGDSVMAYLGTYEVDRGKISAEVRSWIWNTDLPADQLTNVFHMEGNIDYLVRLEGEMDGDTVTGRLWPAEQPEFNLAARMVKIADLP